MDADEIAAVITDASAAVRVQVPNVGTVTGGLRWESIEHLAQVLAPLVEQARQEGAREALLSAASAPIPDGFMNVKRWLRDRAERAARTPGSGTAGGGS